jgi:spermidine synthase
MSRRIAYLAVSLLTASVLILELALTRLFSALLHYHFAFLAISLALFGSASSGVFIYVLGSRRFAGAPFRWLRDACLASGLSVWLLVGLALGGWFGTGTSPSLLDLTVLYAAAALPFFFSGCAITLAIAHFRDDIGRLYLFDLAGGAAGCLLLVPALDMLGGINTLLLSAALAGVAAVLFAVVGREGRRTVTWAGLGAVGLAAGLVWNLGTGRLEVHAAKGVQEAQVLFSKWNSFSRVTVQGDLEARHVRITIDADAATDITKHAGEAQRHQILRGRIEALVYHLRTEGHALIVGAGGGDDVMLARLYGPRHITAVEVNPIIARDIMSREPFLTYSGRIFEQPGVDLVVDEGRSFIRRSTERYDVIQGTMVDTWAATAGGALALTENYLYTVEAFRDYVDHLSDEGVLSMTRWYFEPPDQVLRLVSIARALMDERRMPRPDWHVILVKDTRESHQRAPATFLLKRSEFTAEEVQTIEGVARENELDILYTPLTRPANDFTRLLEAPDPRTLLDTLPSNVAPTTDDSPFFFHSVRFRDMPRLLHGAGEWRKTNLGTFLLVALSVISVLVVALFVLGPLALSKSSALVGSGRLPAVGYFACLGLGFIMVEVALVQKLVLLLGHPVYSLTVVLFSVLTFSAMGSGLSERLAARPLSRLRTVLAVLVVLVVVYAFGLSHLIGASVHLPRGARILVAVTLIAPAGILMGMPMPAGIRGLARRAPDLIPWAWGVNGATSVTGSVLALVVALLGGFTATFLLGAMAYAGAAMLARGLADEAVSTSRP